MTSASSSSYVGTLSSREGFEQLAHDERLHRDVLIERRD
jgi:hypothetical protein